MLGLLRTFVDGIDHNLNRNRSCSILCLPISLSRFPSWFHLYLGAMPERRCQRATSNLLLPVHIIRIVLADNRMEGRSDATSYMLRPVALLCPDTQTDGGTND